MPRKSVRKRFKPLKRRRKRSILDVCSVVYGKEKQDLISAPACDNNGIQIKSEEFPFDIDNDEPADTIENETDKLDSISTALCYNNRIKLKSEGILCNTDNAEFAPGTGEDIDKIDYMSTFVCYSDRIQIKSEGLPFDPESAAAAGNETETVDPLSISVHNNDGIESLSGGLPFNTDNTGLPVASNNKNGLVRVPSRRSDADSRPSPLTAAERSLRYWERIRAAKLQRDATTVLTKADIVRLQRECATVRQEQERQPAYRSGGTGQTRVPPVGVPATAIEQVDADHLETNFELLQEANRIMETLLPQYWKSDIGHHGIHVMLLSRKFIRAVQRSIFFAPSGKIILHVHCREVPIETFIPHLGPPVILSRHTIEQFTARCIEIVNRMRNFEICVGQPSEEFKPIWSGVPSGKIDTNPYQEDRYKETIRSTNCPLLVPVRNSNCNYCKILRAQLQRKAAQSQVEEVHPCTPNWALTDEQKNKKLESQQKKILSLSQKLLRATSALTAETTENNEEKQTINS